MNIPATLVFHGPTCPYWDEAVLSLSVAPTGLALTWEGPDERGFSRALCPACGEVVMVASNQDALTSGT